MQSTPQSSHWLPRLLSIWALVALVTFGVMLTHQSDDPRFLGRYSPLVAGLLAGLLLLAAALWVAGRWLREPARLKAVEGRLEAWRGRRGFAALVIGGACVALALMWVFFLGNHLPTYGWLRAFIGLSILLGVLALLPANAAALPDRMRYLPWSGLALLLAVALFTTPFYPHLMKTDEAFVFSMARNALENGHFRPLIYVQAYPEYYYGGLWTWMMAAWMKLFGVSLESARLYNLALACVSLAAIWSATSRLFDRVTAWYVALIGAYAFMALNHIRFDIHTAFWLSLGMLVFSLARPGRGWAYCLAGFTLGLGVDSNPVAYCFSLGLLAFLGWEYLRIMRQDRRWFWPPFWLALLGAVGALALYLITHAGASFAGGQTSRGLLSNYVNFIHDNLTTGGYVQQVGQYLGVFLTTQPLLFVLMAAGIVTGLWERTRSDRFLLVMYAAWMGVIVFAYFYFPSFYLLLAVPIFVILAARGLSHGVALLLNADPQRLRRGTTILLLVWLLASVAYELRVSPSQSLEDVVETGRAIARIIPPDAVIVAAEPYYFGMLDHSRFVGGAVESIMTNLRGLALDAVWPTIAPDAVVFSQGWPTEPERSPALVSYMDEQQFTLLACYQTHSFGRVELWTKTIPPGVSPSEACVLVCNPRTGCQ